MNSFEDLTLKIKNEDLFFKHLKIDSLNYFPLINRIILNQKKNLIIVAPSKKELAYLSSLYSSLTFFKKNYAQRLSNFQQWLKPNCIVSLCSSGKETGKLYKYLEQKNENYISLGLINDPSVKIEQRIDTLLQFYPISADPKTLKNKIGKNGYFPKPKRTAIDDFLDINSYGNTLLYENKIILLTDYYKSFKNFLESESIVNNDNKNHYNKTLSEIIKCDQIDPEGKLKVQNAEPLILYTTDLSNIYSYLNDRTNSQQIICDSIRKISNNISIFDQIKNLNENFNFLIFAEESEFDEIKELNKNNEFNVWKFENDEIEKIINHEKPVLNNSSAEKIIIKNVTHLTKKEIYLEVKENIFNNISLHLKKIIQILSTVDEQNKNLIRDIMNNLHIKLYQLRDYIFGFTEEIEKELNSDIENYFTRLKSTESFINRDLYDELVEFGNLFKKIELETELFKGRLNEYRELLKQLENEEYATLVYNLKRKNYYENGAKNLWELKGNCTYTLNSSKTINNLIVPSDLTRDKIQKLILSDNFKNKYFIGSKVLKTDINDEKEYLKKRWKNIILNKTEKCEVLNIDQKFEHLFHTTEFLDTQNDIKNEKTDIGKFFTKEFSDVYNREDDNEVETTPAFLVVFNGDAYAFLTENRELEIFNSIFDPTAYKTNKSFIKKNYKNILFDDIVLFRHQTDKKDLDQESILVSGENINRYFEIKKETEIISLIINKSFALNKSSSETRNLLNIRLKEVGYDKHINNVISLSEFNKGTICPNNFSDLEKIFKACELQNPEFKYNQLKAKEIFRCAKIYKKIRIKAGRSITDKLRKAIKNSHDLNFDGSPLRVDYNEGKVTFGNENAAGDPEGYIVQVNNYEEPRKLKKTKLTLTNKLLFT